VTAAGNTQLLCTIGCLSSHLLLSRHLMTTEVLDMASRAPTKAPVKEMCTRIHRRTNYFEKLEHLHRLGKGG
jgi:hypothetical protein